MYVPILKNVFSNYEELAEKWSKNPVLDTKDP